MKIYLSRWANYFALSLSLVVLIAGVWISWADGPEAGIWFILMAFAALYLSIKNLIARRPIVEIFDDRIELPIKGQNTIIYWVEVAKVELKEGKMISAPVDSYLEISFKDNRKPVKVGLPDLTISISDIADLMNARMND